MPDQPDHSFTHRGSHSAGRLSSSGEIAADKSLTEANASGASLLHELSSMIDGTGRYVRVALDLIEQGDADGARNALLIADDAFESMTSSIKAGVIAGSEQIRSLGDSVVHAFKNNQPTHHAISSAITLHAKAAEEAGAKLGVSMAVEVLEVGQLPVFAIIQNALRNAIAAVSLQDGGRIEVDVRVVPDPNSVDSECLLILIVDDGPGLALGSEDPFTLGVTGRTEGTGIGLTICKDIADSLGGTVSLGSVPISRRELAWGTTCFSALIPIRPAACDVLIGEDSTIG